MTSPDAQPERGSRDSGEAFERFSRVVDGPMMILALAMIPLIIVPLIVDLSPGLDRALVAIDYLVWAAFTVEYVIKLYLAPDRWRFVKANIPDLVIVVVPMLRPLRVLRGARLLRLLRLARLVAFAVEGLSEVRSMVMPIDDNHGGVKPEQYPLTGSFRSGTISLALDQGLGVKLSVSGRLTTDGALQLDWTSSAGNLVEWTYRARSDESDESAAPPPTTNPPTTCEGYRQRDHADYKCDGDYFANGSQIPDDAPMALRPPASGPCPKGYPTVSHFQCTTPTIPPDQWPPNP